MINKSYIFVSLSCVKNIRKKTKNKKAKKNRIERKVGNETCFEVWKLFYI